MPTDLVYLLYLNKEKLLVLSTELLDVQVETTVVSHLIYEINIAATFISLASCFLFLKHSLANVKD